MSMNLPLLDIAERHTAESSVRNYLDLLPFLPARRLSVLLAVARYLERTGWQDVTSGELSEATGLNVLSVRPRCCELLQAGLLQRGPVRRSRVAWERPSHGVRHTVPLAAIERAVRQEAA